MSKKIVVQKYGGATLSDPQKIKSVAARISELHKQNTQVVAVVSAMGKTTNQLIELANQVSHRPNRRELDMLLTTGERVSMALVTMALHDLNCPAISFTGSQAGILTNESHFNAYIIDVKATRVDEALKENKVVVLAGFQGVSPKTKEITTLGRGGSDSSAVAMAAYLNAERCEILKDVPAVFTTDPNLVADAKIINELNYDQLFEMTFWGAKVLYHRSVDLARDKKVQLYIGPASEKTTEGTFVSADRGTKNSRALAVNSHETVLKISCDISDLTSAQQQLEDILNKVEIAFPQILLKSLNEKVCEFFVTASAEILNAIKKELKEHHEFKLSSEPFCSVTLTHSQKFSEKDCLDLREILKNIEINIFREIKSSLSCSFVISSTDRLKAIRAFHEKIS